MVEGRLGRIVAAVMDQTDDALFSMADKAETNQLQTLYFDAMREVRLKRPAIETGSRESLLQLFDERSRRARERPAAEIAPAHGPLGLVDLDELEESLAVDNMTRKLGESAREHLHALRLRLGHLLGRRDLAADEDPLGPDVFCRSFQQSCRNLESGIEVKLIVLKLFDRYAFDDVVQLYADLNHFLAERNVLRELPSPQPERGRRPRPRRRAAAEEPEGGDDVFAMLQGLLAGAAGEGGGGGGAGRGGDTGARGGAGGGAVTTGAVVSDLTVLQRGGEAAGVLAGAALAPATGGAPENMLQSLRASGVLQAGTADAATLDIVAMMFDYILDDDALPAIIKAQLARLQIPILKVALLDRSVFSNRQHSARLLVDSLAAAGVGLRQDEEVDQPLFQEIARVVERVLEEFDDNLELFDELLRELQDFLAAEVEKAELTIDAEASRAAEAERREVARDRAEREVRQRLERPRVPVPVGQFLDRDWRRVLEHAALEEGRGAGGWKLDVETMDILLWSLEPKGSAGERRRLVGLLPELLRRLKDGARRIDLPAAAVNRFVSELAPLHARAVRPPEEVAEEHGLPVLEDRPGSVSPPPAAAAEPDPDPEFVAIVTELDRGTWLAFHSDTGDEVRARLSWVSSISGRYLFTDRRGHKVLERSPRELALALAAGEAVIIDDEPLFDRVVTSLMDELSAAA